MDGTQRANAAQLAARNIKAKPNRRGGNRPLPGTSSYPGDSVPQWATPSQETTPFSGGTSGTLFGGGIQAPTTGGFNFNAGPGAPTVSFGASFSNFIGTNNAAVADDSDRDSDRPVSDRATKRQFGASANPPSQTSSVFGQNQSSCFFGAPKPQPSASSSFTFGSTSQMPTSSSISFPPTSSSNLFQFGSVAAEPASGIIFGAGTSSDKPAGSVFAFGQTASQPVLQQPAEQTFGFAPSTAPENPPSSTFSFSSLPAAPVNFNAGSASTTTSSIDFNSGTPAAVPTGNIFGKIETKTPSQSSNLFGSSTTQGQTSNIFANIGKAAAPSTMTLFGSQGQTPPKITGTLFAAQENIVPNSVGTLFGTVQNNSAKPTSNMFGKVAADPPKPTSNMFGNSMAVKPAGSLFGNNAVDSPKPVGNVFGNTLSDPAKPASNSFANNAADSPKPTTNLFETKEQNSTKPAASLFGNISQSSFKPTSSIFSNKEQDTPKPVSTLFSNLGQSPAKPRADLFGVVSPEPMNAPASPVPSFAQIPKPAITFGQNTSSTNSPEETNRVMSPAKSLFENSTIQPEQSSNVFGSMSAASPSNIVSMDNGLFGTLNQPFGPSSLPKTNGSFANTLDTSPKMNGNVFSQASQSLSSAQLVPSAIRKPNPITGSDPIWNNALYANPTPYGLEISTALQQAQDSEGGSIEKDPDGPEEPEPPSFQSQNADSNLIDREGNPEDYPRLFPGMVFAMNYPIERMTTLVPPHFTPEQQVEFYTAYRMHALNKAMQRYFSDIQLTDNVMPAMKFYSSLRQNILARKDPVMIQELANLKRKALEEPNKVAEHPSKRFKPVKAVAFSNQSENIQSERTIGKVTENSNSGKLLQPYTNGNSIPKSPFNFSRPSPALTPAISSPSKGKRKAGDELTKDSYEQESSSPLKRAKTHIPNGNSVGSNTSALFKSALNSPSKSPTKRSSERTLSSVDTVDEPPRVNPFGCLPMSPVANPATTVAPLDSLSGSQSAISARPASPIKSFAPSPAVNNTAQKPVAKQPNVFGNVPASSPGAAIKPPNFGAPVNYLSQFGDKASKDKKSNEEKLMERAKEEDMDSDEDEGEWEANYKIKRAAELKELEDLAKSKRPKFIPGKGFVYDEGKKETGSKEPEISPKKATDDLRTSTEVQPLFGKIIPSGSSKNSVFTPLDGSRTSTPGLFSGSTGSVLDSYVPGKPIQTTGLFSTISDVDSGSGKGDDAAEDSADEASEGESDSENKDPSHTPAGESRSGPGTPGTPAEETGAGIASAKKAPAFMFGATGAPKYGGAFGAGSTSGTSSPGGSLFDRIQKDTNGNPIRQSPSEEKENSGTSTPGGSLFDRIQRDNNGNPIRQIPSEEKENTKPSTANIFGDISKSPFASLNKPAGAPSDQTWKVDSPIKFGNTTTISEVKSFVPTVIIQAATPNKPVTPFGNIFGSKTQGQLGFSTSSTPFGNIFGSSNGVKATTTPSAGFVFGAPSGTSSLFPSATTSRATTPGGTTDGDSQAEGDTDAEHHEQIDLTTGGPGEENEEVVHDVRAKALKFDESEWKTKGVGPLRVLKHKDTNATRILLRADPSGTIVLNKALLSQVKYEATAKTIKLLTASESGDGFETWLLQLKTPELAKSLSQVMEANKRS